MKFFSALIFLLEIFFGLQNFSSKNFLSSKFLLKKIPKSENDKKITENGKKQSGDRPHEPLRAVDRKLAVPPGTSH